MIRIAATVFTLFTLFTLAPTSAQGTGKQAVIAQSEAASLAPTAPARPAITAEDFIGEWAGVCARQMDRETSSFRLSLTRGESGIQGRLIGNGRMKHSVAGHLMLDAGNRGSTK